MTNSAQRLVFWVERFLKRIVSTIGFLVVLLASPGVSLAQDPSVATVDEDKIRECVQSIETSRALINIYVSDDACVLAETYRCVRLNKQSGRPLNDVMRDCGEAELEIWEKLLKQTYEAAIASVGKTDADTGKGPGPDPGPSLPSFIAAHEAWRKSAEADCEFTSLAVRWGTASTYTYPWCKVVVTAKRVFYIRRPGVAVP